jgi:hypothetical protein
MKNKRAKKGKNSEENFHLKSLVKKSKKTQKNSNEWRKSTHLNTQQHLQQQQQEQQEL